MAKLDDGWRNAFNGSFETEEDVIEFIFNNIDTKNWEESCIDITGNHEPNETFKQTIADKKQLLYDFMMELVENKKLQLK